MDVALLRLVTQTLLRVSNAHTSVRLIWFHDNRKAFLGKTEDHKIRYSHPLSKPRAMRLELNRRNIDNIVASAQTSEAPTLNLTQSATATEECDRTNSCSRRQGLEQIPGSIVEEENTLKGKERAQENSVWKRRGLECGGKVVHVCAEEEPLQRLAEHSVITALSYQASQCWEGGADKSDKRQ